MAKRLVDITVSLAALILLLPLLVICSILIFAQDGHLPLYRGVRVGRFGRDFTMIKLRTMVPGGDRLGGSSTASSDRRLTRFGSVLRRYKFDELPQFWNVLVGDMSIVGPRPNLRLGGVERYTSAETQLLEVRPGITDLASIVFSDEGEILRGSTDPDAMYEAVIRPWKSRLALLYVSHRSLGLDLRLILVTLLGLISRRLALRQVGLILEGLGANAQLRRVCARSGPVPAGVPPGRLG